MNDAINLSTFPSNKYEALAMAYLNSRDLSDKKPEDIARLYSEALEKIKAELRNTVAESTKSEQKLSY